MTADEQKPLCARHEKLLADIHLAVCGNTELGVNGLVADVRDIKDWRRKMDLRVAKIAGGAVLLLFVVKFALEKLL